MLLGNLTNYPYSGNRKLVMGVKGAVATSQPLAAMAGMEMLWAGGNAVDAAIATSIALTVVEPTSNGIGSDAFAIVWDGKLHGLNASGKSPQSLTFDKCVGLNHLPLTDWRSVTVPGAVSGWRALWSRWGRLPFEKLFAPAIRYAEEGFPVSPITSMTWKWAENTYMGLEGQEFKNFQKIFFPSGRAPYCGEIWSSPLHAQTLQEIAQTGGKSFYQGQLARKIADFAAQTGGYLTIDDLASHQPEWVSPISTNYHGLTVWELPPNTQGIATLIALNILSGCDLFKYPRESPQSYHLQIEAMKLAAADLYRYVADPRFVELELSQLLSNEYAAQRRSLIGDSAIQEAYPGLPKGGTVYLAAADGELMVSFIQSNYMNFGSGIVPSDTGIALQNRGSSFSLIPGHPNQLAPAKRPFNTIIPGFLTRDNQPIGPFGVMGGSMQPQGHLQMVVNMVDYKMNPQTALDAPRWQFLRGSTVSLEPNVNVDIAQTLIDKGHDVRTTKETFFGRGQIICKHDQLLYAASEPRADGLAIAQ
ncbi:MAG: gamma-glutamyltransferase family protein [Cyanobacteria bacterium P01_A01_bin.80]